MMKKILITFLFSLTVFFVKSQPGFNNTFPAPGTNATTRQTNEGGYWVKKMFQRPTFVDTSAANNGVTEKYAGSEIYTTSDNSNWFRSADTKRWVKFGVQLPGQCAGLITPGIVTWDSLLIFSATNATYCINNVAYSSPSTSGITLATADPTNPRFDAIVVDTGSRVVVLTGTPAANPAFPPINPATQVVLTYILVGAGATTPSGVSREIIYNENVEWATSSSLLGGSVNFASTTFPYIGTIDGDVAANTSGSLIFTKTDTISVDNYNVFQMFIRLKAAFSAFTNIQVAFTLGGTPVTDYITLDNTHGFQKNVINSYQNVSIGLPDFLFTSNSVDGFTMRLTGTNGGFYFDYIQLQSGIIPPSTNFDDRYVLKHSPDTITAVKTFADSLIYFNNAFASPVTILGPPSVPTVWRVNTRDTINGASIVGEIDAFIQGRRGNATPNFDWILKSKNSGVSPITANTTGTVTLGNGLIFNDVSRITSPTTITYFGNSTSLKNDFVNFGQPLAAAGTLIRGRSGSTSGLLSKILQLDGDANLPALYAYTEGIVASGTANPSRKAQMDIVSVGKGVIFPRMNTSQRDGIPKRILAVNISNGGAGMTAAPTITATTTGLRARFTGTVSGGVLTAIAINYTGSNYTSSGSLIIDTTGTNATVLPIATYTVTTDTIPTALIVYNTDSSCYQSYNGSAWINMREGTGGGGGGTWQDALIAGSNLSQDNTIDGGVHLFRMQNLGYTDITSAIDAGVYSTLILDGSDGNDAVQLVHGNNGSVGNVSAKAGLVTILADNNGTNNHQIEVHDNFIKLLSTDTTKLILVNPPIKSAPDYYAVFKNDTLSKAPFVPDTVVNLIYPLQSAVVGATIEQSINQDFLDSVRNNVEPTFTIDLSLGDYTITEPGIYIVTHGEIFVSNKISFPDPTTMPGASITILNNDILDNYNADYGSNKPLKGGNGPGGEWTTLAFPEMHTYKSIGGYWHGGSYGL